MFFFLEALYIKITIYLLILLFFIFLNKEGGWWGGEWSSFKILVILDPWMIGDFVTDLSFVKWPLRGGAEYNSHGCIQADISHSVDRYTVEETGTLDDN